MKRVRHDGDRAREARPSCPASIVDVDVAPLKVCSRRPAAIDGQTERGRAVEGARQ